MSATPCGCQCKATETVTVAEGFSYLPVRSSEQELAASLPLILVMATVLTAVANQRRRAWCILTLRDTKPSSGSGAVPCWKLRLSPAERRFVSAVRTALLQAGAAIVERRAALYFTAATRVM